MMSDIPSARRMISEVRKTLVETNQTGLADLLAEALDLLTRRRAVRRMRAKSLPITAQVRQAIIERASSTDLHASEIASELGVNPGRVSEVLQRQARLNR